MTYEEMQAAAAVAPGVKGTLAVNGVSYPVVVLRMLPHREDIVVENVRGEQVTIPGKIVCDFVATLAGAPREGGQG